MVRKGLMEKKRPRTLLFSSSIATIPNFLLLFLLQLVVHAKHTSNHAVIVSSSRYWFNYRHAINALSIYSLLKDNGFDDDHIILMLADEYASNSRNPYKNTMYANGIHSKSLYNENIEIDYRGEDVTVQNLVHVLTGRSPSGAGLPVLQSDSNSHVLVYLTGHGGDQFFKFQDVEEIMAADLAAAIGQMHYRELLLVADTCQAFTLGGKLKAPNVTIVASSLKGESSYAYRSDPDLGLSVIERYTHAFTEWVRKNGMKKTLKQSMVDPYSYQQQRAHIGYSDDLAVRKMTEVMLSDFFQAVEEKDLAQLQLLDDERPSVSWIPPEREATAVASAINHED